MTKPACPPRYFSVKNFWWAHHKNNSFTLSPFSLIPLIALITLITLIFFFFSRTQRPTANDPFGSPQGKQLLINPQLLASLPVPEVNSHPDDKNIAVPLAALESTPGAKTKIRQFNLQAYKSAFQPNIIMSYAGDIVRINLFAVDTKYDFTIPGLNISQTAQKGETRSMEFQVTAPGAFDIVCSSCNQPQKTRGYLVVKELH